MIKAIIYDADGMVILPPKMFSEYFCNLQHLPTETVTPFFTGEFKSCLRGEKDLKQALIPHLSRWRWSKSVDDLLSLWFEFENVVNQPLLDSVTALRQRGIVCVLATNQEKYRYDYLINQMKINQHFDRVYCSHLIHSLKPEIAFFDSLITDLKIDKSSIMYWDDRPEYVASAKNYGLSAFLYQTVDQYSQVMAAHF